MGAVAGLAHGRRPAAFLLHGDARALPLAAASVHCVVTSPPYWGLRDYGLPPSVWGGSPACGHAWGEWTESHDERETAITGKTRTTDRAYGEASRRFDGNHQKHTAGACCPCGAWRGVLGLEPTPELYVQHMVEIFREVRRVLRDDGTCWVNLGDSYFASPAGNTVPSGISQNTPKRVGLLEMYNTQPKLFPGLKPKDLVGIPWRVAFALQADGWWLRSDIIWAKPNPMPESITDRPTKAHEYLFLLTKSARYYYDSEAIKEPGTGVPWNAATSTLAANGVKNVLLNQMGQRRTAGADTFHRDEERTGRNRRSVWTIATEPYPEAHFATFPEKLVEPCILAGTSERGACPTCGAPWARVVERESNPRRVPGYSAHGQHNGTLRHDDGIGGPGSGALTPSVRTLGWAPACDCDDRVRPGDIDPPIPIVPCRVLDPFAGSGTTVAVAERLGRVGIGVELQPTYLTLARRRTRQAGLL